MSVSNPFAAPVRAPVRQVLRATVKENEPVEVEKEVVGEVPTGTIAEVKRWVGSNKDKAAQALEAENSKEDPRVTLISHLQEVIEGSED